MKLPKAIYHTCKVLRKHSLLVKQAGFGKQAEFSIVDAISRRPASEKRISAWEIEEPQCGAA